MLCVILCCMEQGFLQAELVSEACRGLYKRCAAVSEQLMQSLETIDSIVSSNCIHIHVHVRK